MSGRCIRLLPVDPQESIVWSGANLGAFGIYCIHSDESYVRATCYYVVPGTGTLGRWTVTLLVRRGTGRNTEGSGLEFTKKLDDSSPMSAKFGWST